VLAQSPQPLWQVTAKRFRGQTDHEDPFSRRRCGPEPWCEHRQRLDTRHQAGLDRSHSGSRLSQHARRGPDGYSGDTDGPVRGIVCSRFWQPAAATAAGPAVPDFRCQDSASCIRKREGESARPAIIELSAVINGTNTFNDERMIVVPLTMVPLLVPRLHTPIHPSRRRISTCGAARLGARQPEILQV
jgi:hypothetical protein